TEAEQACRAPDARGAVAHLPLASDATGRGTKRLGRRVVCANRFGKWRSGTGRRPRAGGTGRLVRRRGRPAPAGSSVIAQRPLNLLAGERPMKWTTGLLLPALLLTASVCRADGDRETDVRRSVVRLRAPQRAPNLLQPWLKQEPRDVTGPGVVLDG